MLSSSAEKGFVKLSSLVPHNVSALSHENLKLTVEVEAYPKPVIRWSKDGVDITGDHDIKTQQEQEIK